jgi:uncharacterized protein (TIGR03437 family)
LAASNPIVPDPNGNTQPFAVDPADAQVVYTLRIGAVLKSTDGGLHFSTVGSLPGAGIILVDPANPQTLYAEADSSLDTVYTSTDSGATWKLAATGLPNELIQTLSIDPFSGNLWLTFDDSAWILRRGAAAWSQIPIPLPTADFLSGGFSFDHATQGVVYGPSFINSGTLYPLKSTDGGQTWTLLKTPFLSLNGLVTDAVRAGYVYYLDLSPRLFYRSTDAGSTWQSFPFPANQAGQLSSDPGNPNILIAAPYRSIDDGQTWNITNSSRDLYTVFAPSGNGVVYGIAPVSSDAFVAKFAPDGQTLLFATYYGGMGDDTAAGIQVDALGNIFICGSTDSVDLPGASTGVQTALRGQMNVFVAKFSPAGDLLASTYLGGAKIDTGAALRLDSGGNVWVTGQASSLNFGLTTPPPANPPSPPLFVFLTELDTSLSQRIFSTFVSSTGQEYPGELTIDPSGNVVVAGITYASNFPVSNSAFTSGAGSKYGAFVVKFDHSGNPLFSTYLGGASNFQAGVATGGDGSIYLAGTTQSSTFPTTPGAFQTTYKPKNCPFLTYSIGFMGSVGGYDESDVFVTKLSPDGSTLMYSTLLGGSCADSESDIKITPSGEAVVAGTTDSPDFPTAFPVENQQSAFVTILDPKGAAVPFSTSVPIGMPALALGAQGSTLALGGNANGHGELAMIDLPATFPALNLASVMNDFSRMPGSIAPGEILSLSVPNFRPAQSLDIGLNQLQPLTTTLSDTQVLFDGQPAQLITVFPGTIVCLAPQSFGTHSTVSIMVTSSGLTSNTVVTDIAPSALGLLSADGSGTGSANARNDDGQLNSMEHPAAPGSTVTVFVTGLGHPPAAMQILISSQGASQDVPATVTPIAGFVPGIYAASFVVPAGSIQIAAVLPNQQFFYGTIPTLTVYVAPN